MRSKNTVLPAHVGYIVLIILTAIPTIVHSNFFQESVPTLDYQPTKEEVVNSFLKPVQFSQHGIKNFFSQRFNTKLYSERFLPACFIHVLDWLEYGSQMGKPYSYYESVFNLFHQRLKESEWVNPYALIAFLERLPDFIECLPEKEHIHVQKKIREELENALITKFSLLKENPAAFLNETAEIIAQTSESTLFEHGSFHHLQNALARFLEGALNKLIWTPHDKIDVWKSVKVLAKKCELLHYYGILENIDDVNRLIWSILYRFGYFLECAGSQLSYSFYRTAQQELRNQNFSFLEIEEQEEWLTTKRAYLDKILTEGVLKSQAYEQGIYSDGI